MAVKKGPEAINTLRSEIADELRNVEAVIEEASEEYEALVGSQPDRLQLRAFGSMLHDFYTGTESVFERIAEGLDGTRPTASDWHRRLLHQMALEIDGVRPAVISKELERMLDPYRGFRHVFRNVYGCSLDWGRMMPLLERLSPAYRQLREELRDFCRFLGTLSIQLEKGV